MQTLRHLGITLALVVSGILIAPLHAQAEPEKLVVYSGSSEGLIGPMLQQFPD